MQLHHTTYQVRFFGALPTLLFFDNGMNVKQHDLCPQLVNLVAYFCTEQL